MPVLQEMDAVLYLDDNSLHGAEPIPGFRAGAAANISPLFQKWRDRFARYTAAAGHPRLCRVQCLGPGCGCGRGPQSFRPEIHDAGQCGRRGQRRAGAGSGRATGMWPLPWMRRWGDWPRSVAGAMCCWWSPPITAWSFPRAEGRGGHSAEKYADRLEALRVPLVFFGAGGGGAELGGRWSEADIAPTLLDLLNISPGLSREETVMPVAGA